MISPATTCSSGVDFGTYSPESLDGDGSAGGGACSATSLSALLQDLTVDKKKETR